MSYYLGPNTKAWQAVLAAQIVQALGNKHGVCAPGSYDALFRLAGIEHVPMTAPQMLGMVLDGLDQVVVGSNEYCGQLFAKVNGVDAEVRKLKLAPGPFISGTKISSTRRYIVVAPWGVSSDLMLPEQVWRVVVRLLRTYDADVYLLGEDRQRMDVCCFAESDILSCSMLDEKMSMLHSADLIIGVPNAWTWMAAAWDKKMILFYPDDAPPKRWFPWAHERFGRIIYTRKALQTPAVLAGLRTLMGKM